MAQYIDRTYGAITVKEVQYPDLGPPTGERWYVCRACGFPYRAADVQLIKGQPYCYRNQCAEHKLAERSPSTSVI